MLFNKIFVFVFTDERNDKAPDAMSLTSGTACLLGSYEGSDPIPPIFPLELNPFARRRSLARSCRSRCLATYSSVVSPVYIIKFILNDIYI
jgi:hypothetical protein